MRKETMALARAEAQSGNTVAAENYYRTPNTISELCRQTERNSREGAVFNPLRKHR
jgi:hypothetical protein